MDVLGRYRNLIVLVGVLFAQVLGLAVQVRRTTDSEPTRLIRVWAVGTITPLEKTLVWTQTTSRNIWHNYFYLRGVRAENRSLKAQIERMSLEQVRMSQDADQARRLQALLAFKEQFISETMAAQVIGGSGSELSRSVYIDKGHNDGIKADMAVITADGVVGKVLHVYRSTSLVLLIDDQTSGVGAILDKTRLQGILRGTPSGEVMLEKVMSDETVPAGELVLTSGGDGIFPKGLLVGRVTKVSPGSELFLNIRVRPAADLSRLEEVLVVTKIDERQAEPDQAGAARAIDILAERLPTVPPKPENAAKGAAPGTASPGTVAPAAGAPTTGAPTIVAPKTVAPTAGAPTTTGAAAQPKAAPPAASASSGTPAAQTTVSPGSSSGTGSGTSPATPASAAGTRAVKASPKPAKAAVQTQPQPQPQPKPQPAAQDSPH
ncbi:MAG: rod shape-determining protein MreC [Bryobacteraceae bacterium]|jgi:rod shape-determining protein MreC